MGTTYVLIPRFAAETSNIVLAFADIFRVLPAANGTASSFVNLNSKVSI